MITIQKPLVLPNTYPLERIGPLEDLLFFDIETTGFSGDYASLYLIGCTYYKENHWHLIQWFADTKDCEEELLCAFFHFLEDYKILVHFNGDGFDLPFLLKRCRHFRLPYDFSAVESFDIYRRIRPYRRLLGLDSMKQKAIEQFLGVEREDTFSGGELIEVYTAYLHNHSQKLYDLLILHNEDDLKGMPRILPVLNYPDFLEHEFCLVSWRLLDKTCSGSGSEAPAITALPSGAATASAKLLPSGIAAPARGSLPPDTKSTFLELVCESSYEIPAAFTTESEMVRCTAKGSRLCFTIRLYRGIMKHFYPNYKDYYYLIYEDTAVHKSVGEYVDKSARTRATARTCYTRMEGIFVPQFSPIWEPVMKLEPKDKVPYAPLEQLRLEETDAFARYLEQLFGQLGVKHPYNDKFR